MENVPSCGLVLLLHGIDSTGGKDSPYDCIKSLGVVDEFGNEIKPYVHNTASGKIIISALP